MPLEGLDRVRARIAALEQQSGARPPTTAPAATPHRPSSTSGEFEAVLSREMQPVSVPSAWSGRMADRPALAPAVRKSPGAYGSLTPPAELQQYGNGRVPDGALSPIGVGDHRLWAPAGEAFSVMRADAAAAGVTLGVTDSYRSYAEQVDVARRKGLYSEGGLAAVPGTSNHGWGLSLDLDLNDRALAWMRENAHRYGFVEDVAREPWHWTYRPA